MMMIVSRYLPLLQSGAWLQKQAAAKNAFRLQKTNVHEDVRTAVPYPFVGKQYYRAVVYPPVSPATRQHQQHTHGSICKVERMNEKRKENSNKQTNLNGTREKTNQTCAQGAGRVPRKRLLFAGTINRMICSAIDQRKDTTTTPDRRQEDKTRL